LQGQTRRLKPSLLDPANPTALPQWDKKNHPNRS
jgi:hypothetical protein